MKKQNEKNASQKTIFLSCVHPLEKNRKGDIMRNLIILEKLIENSGLKKVYIAKQLNLSLRTLYNRLNGKSEFKASEIVKICDLLSLTNTECNKIFFNE